MQFLRQNSSAHFCTALPNAGSLPRDATLSLRAGRAARPVSSQALRARTPVSSGPGQSMLVLSVLLLNEKAYTS